MKYKLIHSQTKEEHLCDKVTIDGFDYYVSNEKIHFGYVWNTILEQVETMFKEKTFHNDLKGIIATTNPNIHCHKVVDEVEIEEFAWEEAKCKFHADEGREPNINNEKDCFVVGVLQEGVIHGYNKSQETHPFSEDDMIEFAKWIDKNSYFQSLNEDDKWFFNDFIDMDKDATLIATDTKELLQLWKEQQPKIVYYNE